MELRRPATWRRAGWRGSRVEKEHGGGRPTHPLQRRGGDRGIAPRKIYAGRQVTQSKISVDALSGRKGAVLGGDRDTGSEAAHSRLLSRPPCQVRLSLLSLSNVKVDSSYCEWKIGSGALKVFHATER